MTDINKIEAYYLEQEEPTRSTLLFLRKYLLDDPLMTESWKYSLPFFMYRNRMFSYFWRDAKTLQPYMGFARADRFEHALLIQGDRKKMKVLFLDPSKDLPMKDFEEIIKRAKSFY